MNKHTFPVIGASLLITATALADVEYSYQDGVLTDHVDVALDVTTDAWWANEFTAQPGGNLITQVQVAFGNNFAAGTPVSILLYNDPNNDGLPSDLVLLQQVAHNVVNTNSSAGSTLLDTIDIPDTLVSGNFFVGILALNIPGNYNIRSEITATHGRSWVAWNETNLNTFDPSNPAAAEQPPVIIDSLAGIGIDWVVRATGTVPTPSSFTILATGSFLATRRRR